MQSWNRHTSSFPLWTEARRLIDYETKEISKVNESHCKLPNLKNVKAGFFTPSIRVLLIAAATNKYTGQDTDSMAMWESLLPEAASFGTLVLEFTMCSSIPSFLPFSSFIKFRTARERGNRRPRRKRRKNRFSPQFREQEGNSERHGGKSSDL